MMWMFTMLRMPSQHHHSTPCCDKTMDMLALDGVPEGSTDNVELQSFMFQSDNPNNLLVICRIWCLCS